MTFETNIIIYGSDNYSDSFLNYYNNETRTLNIYKYLHTLEGYYMIGRQVLWI